jgi:hypothetical protein
MYPTVRNVSANDNYTLSIEFDNGEQGVLDMKEYLEFGVFQRLKDPQVFRKVHVVFDTVEWEAGLDLDPEFVYRKCRKRRMKSSA